MQVTADNISDFKLLFHRRKKGSSINAERLKAALGKPL